MAEAGMAGAQAAPKSNPPITLIFPDGAERQYAAGQCCHIRQMWQDLVT